MNSVVLRLPKMLPSKLSDTTGSNFDSFNSRTASNGSYKGTSVRTLVYMCVLVSVDVHTYVGRCVLVLPIE